MPTLTNEQRRFLASKELCHLATASAAGAPHVTPVLYATDRSNVVIVIDYGTKKLKNLKENSKVSLVVDDYHPNRAIVIHGDCEIYENGKEYRRLLKILFKKFKYYRSNPWREGEAPILKITPKKIISWGLSLKK
jgi:uncharacterized protein